MPLKLAEFLRDRQSQKQVGNGLLDAANRGLVAQTIGAPVDAANAPRLVWFLMRGTSQPIDRSGLHDASRCLGSGAFRRAERTGRGFELGRGHQG